MSFPFAVILSMREFQERPLDKYILTPKYFTLVTIPKTWPCNWYEEFVTFLEVVTFTSWHLERLNSFCHLELHIDNLYKYAYTKSCFSCLNVQFHNLGCYGVLGERYRASWASCCLGLTAHQDDMALVPFFFSWRHVQVFPDNKSRTWQAGRRNCYR